MGFNDKPCALGIILQSLGGGRDSMFRIVHFTTGLKELEVYNDTRDVYYKK